MQTKVDTKQDIIDYLRKSITFLNALKARPKETQADIKKRINSVSILEGQVKKQIAFIESIQGKESQTFGSIYTFLKTFEKQCMQLTLAKNDVSYEEVINFDKSIEELIRDITIEIDQLQIKPTAYEKKDRLFELRRWGLDIDKYPQLAEFLVTHFEDARTLEENDNFDGLFNYGLPTLASVGLINEKMWPQLVKDLVKISCTSGAESTWLFSKDFPWAAKLGIINEKTWPGLAQMLIDAGSSTDHIMSSLRSIAEKGPINEIMWPGIVQIAIGARSSATDVLYTISDLAEIGLINEKTWPTILYEVPLIRDYCKGAEKETYAHLPRIAMKLYGLDVFPLIIRPVMKSQTVASYLSFEQIDKISELGALQTKEDAQFIVSIINAGQRRAFDILKNFIVKGIEQEMIETPLSIKKDCLSLFLRESPLYLPELYGQFKSLYDANHPQKELLYSGLFKDAKALIADIKQGSVSKNYDKKLLISALYSVFQPELSVDREKYNKIFESRNDRDYDIPGELSKYKKLNVKISKGSYVQTGEIDVKAWNNIVEAVEYVNKNNSAFDFAKIGLELVAGKIGNKLQRHIQLYAFFKSTGESLPTFSSDRETLMKYKEYVGDRLKNDIIAQVLGLAKQKYPTEYYQLDSNQVQYTGLIKQISNIWNNNVKDKENKISDIFRRNGIPVQQLNWTTPVNPQQILQTIQQATQHGIKKELVSKIFGQLCGEEYTLMQEQMKKFQFKSEGMSLFGDQFEFVLSKKKLHCLSMFNMGICVAPDEQLWNSKDMWQMIIFDNENYAHGGCIFRTIIDNGKPYLVVSIQPSSTLLVSYSADHVYSKVIQYARILVKKLKYEGLLIPQRASIHSNRSSIQACISAANYPTITTKQEHDFSYSPYQYKYQTFYIV